MITILGGGIGGLTLAAILTRNNVACRVLDADASLTSRHQGGMLNINEGGAHQALVDAGVYEAFQSSVLVDGDALKLMNKNGEVLIDMPGDGSRPEIDRGSLRKVLADSLPEGVIRWGVHVSGVARRADGKFVLSFSDGHEEVVDTLVGADGAWSRVRPLLTAERPAYTGITFVEYRLLNASRDWPVAKKTIGGGLYFALADGRGIMGHREPDDEICVYAAARVTEDHYPAQPTHDQVKAEYPGWHPDFLTILSGSNGPLAKRSIYALPVGLTWDRVPGVTLLGDAAHVMSPFAGAGANMAMEDAGSLARQILAFPGEMERAFAGYEAEMWARSAPVARLSADYLLKAFAPDAPKPFHDAFTAIMNGEVPQ